jgi:hypothetical protein
MIASGIGGIESLAQRMPHGSLAAHTHGHTAAHHLCELLDEISTQPAPSPLPTRRIPMVSSAACSSSIHRKSTPASTTRGIRSYITWFTTM